MIIENKVKTINGAQAIIETLKSFGTDTIFGYPGGIVLGLYDELYNHKEINHILVRHEQSAVHAAEGYSRVSGKCGVVIVTSGPGATNTVTGIVNAYLDGYPLIVLTGQVLSNCIGKDSFQEANICDITKSCTKKVFQITNAKDIQETLTEAYKIAMSGKKGPVVIDLVKDIFSQKVDYIEKDAPIEKGIIQNYKTDISDFLTLLSNSERPVIVSGGGVKHSKAEDELLKISSMFNIPVVCTMMSLGTYDYNNEKYFGMIGIFGDKSANEILKRSDLIISLGARFNDRITCMFQDNELDHKIIQIDINNQELFRNIKPIKSICSDIKSFLTSIVVNKDLNFKKWLDKSQILKKDNKIPQKTTNLIHSYEVIQALEKITKGRDIIFTSEVGQHQLWAVQNLELYKNRQILVSGGSGTMGFGLPAAIGACIANPNNPVVCIAGDGSIQMSLGELALCKDYDLNLKIIILNNGYLGMVRQLQENNCNRRYSQTKISNPDFVKLAQSYGIEAVKVSSYDNIYNALEKAFSTDKSYIIDFEVEPMEVV